MFSQKKPYTAVTVTVERLTGENVAEEDLSGIPDLVEVVTLQDSGPQEAARAIRKKLKYGSVHRQLRALVVLDGLIQNAGPKFQLTFADEPLLERLRFCATAELSNPAVKKKCAELFRGWAVTYKNTRGMERVANLHKELPRRKQAVTQTRSKVLKETENPFGEDGEDEDDDEDTEEAEGHQKNEPPTQPPERIPISTNPAYMLTGRQLDRMVAEDRKKKKEEKQKEKEKKRREKEERKQKSTNPQKSRPFNLEAEKETIKSTIADASIASTKLTNALHSINREKERISENQAAVELFNTCKKLRRQIYRYIHLVESEEWLGTLLHANDELVLALITYEQLDRSIDADSDSDDEVAEQAHLYRMATEKGKGKESNSAPAGAMADLSLDGSSSPPQPPRPAPPPRPSAASKPSQMSPPPSSRVDDSEDEADEDDNDPFADKYAV